MRLVREEAQVVQPRPGAAGERHVVHGLLAVHPGGVDGLVVLDGLGQPEPEPGVVLVGARHVGHADVEVVEPRHLGPAPQVVPLLQPLRMHRGSKKIHQKAKRVLDPHHLPDAPYRTRRQPCGPAAQGRVVRLGPGQVTIRPHPVPERAGRGLRPGPDDQVVVRELVVSPQVQGRRILMRHDEAEQVDPEAPGFREVGHDQRRVRRPHDVRRGQRISHRHAPNRGTCVSPSATCTIRDDV